MLYQSSRGAALEPARPAVEWQNLAHSGFSGGKEMPGQQTGLPGTGSFCGRCWWGLGIARATPTTPTPIKSSLRSTSYQDCCEQNRQTERWHASQDVARQFVCSHPASSRGEFSWWLPPSQKELSDGIHLVESYVPCTHQNGCGNPDGAPMKTCSHPGPRLQRVPGPFTGNGWQ